MRCSTLLAILALIVSAPADAELRFTWTRASLQFTNLGRAEASVTSSGLATLSTSSATSSHLSTVTLGFDPALSLNTAIPVTDPGAAASITAVILTSIRGRPDLQGGVFGNISGAVAGPAPGMLPKTMPLTGGLTFCVIVAPLPPCVAQLNFALAGTLASAVIGAGVGGILTIGGTGTVQATVVGAPYTVQTVSVPNRTANEGLELFFDQGFAHGPVSLTSSTALTGGVLQIVTATRIIESGVLSDEGDLSGNISRILTHFLVPEPGFALLLGAGVGTLAWLGRRRRRS